MIKIKKHIYMYIIIVPELVDFYLTQSVHMFARLLL